MLNRIREIRSEKYTVTEIAQLVHVSAVAWMDYERGVHFPSRVLLRFLDETSVNPRWLLTGDGDKYCGCGLRTPSL